MIKVWLDSSVVIATFNAAEICKGTPLPPKGLGTV